MKLHLEVQINQAIVAKIALIKLVLNQQLNLEVSHEPLARELTVEWSSLSRQNTLFQQRELQRQNQRRWLIVSECNPQKWQRVGGPIFKL